MSKDRFAGIWLELSGWIGTTWGELIGDARMAVAGRHDQAVGRAQQDGALVRAEAERQLEDFRQHHRNWLF